MPGGKSLPVPEDWPQCNGHGPSRCLAPNQILVDAMALELCMQPLGPRRVAVAVAQECTVLERDRIGHVNLLLQAIPSGTSATFQTQIRLRPVYGQELTCGYLFGHLSWPQNEEP